MDNWNGVWSALEKGGNSADVRWYIIRGSNEEVSRGKFIYKAREVKVKGKKSKIIRSSDWTRKNKNRARKSEGGIKLASSQRSQECIEVLKTY